MADIVGCINFAGSIISLCYKYGSALADASNDAKAFAFEATSLSGLLLGVQAATQQDTAEKSSVENLDVIVAQCADDLCAIEKRLQLQAPYNESRGFRRQLRKASWPFHRDENQKFVETLQRHKVGLSLALNILSAHTDRAQNEQLEQISSTVDELRHLYIDDRNSKTRQDALLWLPDSDQVTQHQRNCRLRYANIGSWFFQNTSFALWQERQNSLLWYQADTGSGKTLLASYIYERLQQDASQNDAVVAYHYFDTSTSQSLSQSAFMSSILRQACNSRDSLAAHVEAAVSKARRSIYGLQPPSDQQLQSLLRDILRDISDFVLVVDAVDESDSPEEICMRLRDIQSWLPHQCHIIMTSRPGLSTVGALSGCIQLPAPRSYLQRDILEYVDHRFEIEGRLQKMSRSMRNDVRYYVARDAGGIWVQCLLDDLCKLRTDRDVKDALRTMPSSLGGVYQRTLDNINVHDRGFARRSLLWLCHSLEPLKLSTAAEVAVFESHMVTISSHDRLLESRDVLAILAGLVSYSGRVRKVALSHHSVREYLINNSDPMFHFPVASSHRSIAELCLHYLLMQEFCEGPREYEKLHETLRAYPLLWYAARKWTNHVILSGAEADLQPLILRLMTPKINPSYLFWLQIVLLNSKYGFTVPGVSGTALDPAPLHYAASYGLHHTVKSLIEQGAELDTPAGQRDGTALHVACHRRHESIVELLLDAGANKNIFDRLHLLPYDLLENWLKATPELLERLEPDLEGRRQRYANKTNRRVQLLRDSLSKDANSVSAMSHATSFLTENSATSSASPLTGSEMGEPPLASPSNGTDAAQVGGSTNDDQSKGVPVEQTSGDHTVDTYTDADDGNAPRIVAREYYLWAEEMNDSD